jgi:hypothetical protein
MNRSTVLPYLLGNKDYEITLMSVCPYVYASQYATLLAFALFVTLHPKNFSVF